MAATFPILKTPAIWGRKEASIINVILYTRQGCHLCDEALQTLLQHDLEVQTVDIDPHPELREQWGTCVPVVEMDGKVRFRGRIDPVLLRRLIAHRE
ncbi:MAG: glutaredoxin family protein [Pirellulales bacterium]|nr:glutaredoxin family protein [Pirellulales bacterium]